MRRLYRILIILFFIAASGIYPGTAMAQNAFRLSLDEATRIALENNFDIQLAKYDAWVARTDKDVAKSIYDTIFTGEVGYRDDQSKQTSTIFGSKTVTNDYNVGLSKKLPTGTTLGVDMTNKRNFTNSAFTTSPLTHESTLELSVEQALGKNFFGIQDRGNVKITLLDIENVEYTTIEKIEDNLAQVQKSYWNLVLQYERVAIEEDMVAQAKRLYDLNQKKLEDGVVELPDVFASEANYKERLNLLRLVQNEVKSKENVLRLSLNITNDDVAIEPTQQFILPDRDERLDLSLKNAFENRWDYKRVRNDIKAKNIKVSMNKNNIWPEINLQASLARNGLGDHFSQSAKQISQEDNPNFFAGLRIVFPLENREARAQLKAAQLEKAKILLNFKFVERKIAIEINDQVRNCNVFREVAFNDVDVADVQSKKLAEEQKRFFRGRSDTDTIIRFQKDVNQARLLAAQSKFRYYAALVDLRVRESTLLGFYWDGEL